MQTARDLAYFADEIEKIRRSAINLLWKPPPHEGAQIIFCSEADPKRLDVKAWASALLRLETYHNVPITVSGGGYGCFAVSVETPVENADRVAAALEKDDELHSHLSHMGTRYIELWRHYSGRSDMEIWGPQYSCTLFLATNRKRPAALTAGDTATCESFSGIETGELTIAELKLRVYDPSITREPSNGWKRFWSKLRSLVAVDLPEIEVTGFKIISPASLLGAVTQAAGANRLEERIRVSIFVHGFAMTMKDAIETIGRLIYNVRYEQAKTVPLLYCWPSAGSASKYPSDVPRAERSEKKLNALLAALAPKDPPVPFVDLLSHSHGAKLTFRALITPTMESERVPNPVTIRNVVFIAPDIDVGTLDEYWPEFRRRARNVTIYQSRGDVALWFSELIQSERAGRSRLPTDGQIENIDIIDGSRLRADWLGHSYYIGCPEMHEDLRGILERFSADRRRLLYRDAGNSPVWLMRPVR